MLYLSEGEKNKLYEISKSLVGVPYKFGAEIKDLSIAPEDVEEIDCSELVQYVFHKIGYSVPDGSFHQYNASVPVTDLQVGNLVFKQKNEAINHVGILCFNNPMLIVEAEGWYGRVVIRTLAEFKKTSPKASQFAGTRCLLLENTKKL